MAIIRPSDPTEALIWDYQLRQRVPDFQDFFDQGVALSAQTYARLSVIRDQPYGDRHPREAFDLFPAERPGGPILMFIHGGYWQFLSRDMFAFVAGPLVDAGVTVALLGYPLTPDVSMTRLADAVARGVVQARDAAGQCGADRDRLHLAGHSAGGHLASLMGTWDWTDQGRPVSIKSVTAISGIYDLADIPQLPQNEVIGLTDAEVTSLSPAHRPRPARPALALHVGEAETRAFHDQQAAMAAAWSEAGIPVATDTVPDRHHFDVVLDLADPAHKTTKALISRVIA